ncbi:MAG: thiamine pyrophosphate-dependent dehydrogenase E1 component subunit alpha [Candidatus Latescibacteria bacterium]|nr:thiamine pyrophosphate-dependent dehydrogenase E1 component subunit alpha [Candidatus Latescibacterota bacterium]
MYSKEFLTNLYRQLFTIRIFESRCIQLYRKGLIRGYFHPYLGEEAIAVGVCAALKKNDYITSTHRGHGHCIARGADINRMVAELLGKKTGYCRGLGGSMHIADHSGGNIGANGIVGGGIPLGTGAALGISIRNEDRVSVVFTSDGATNNGVFGESLNLAAIWNLPLLIVVENNQYAVSTPIDKSTREPDIYKRCIGYCVDSSVVDGNDVLEVYEQAQKAVEKCRSGKGPILIEAKTYRHGGHHVNDPGHYMPKEQLEYYKSKDPVVKGRSLLLESGAVSEKEIVSIEETVKREFEEAVDFAQESPEMTVDEFRAIGEVY